MVISPIYQNLKHSKYTKTDIQSLVGLNIRFFDYVAFCVRLNLSLHYRDQVSKSIKHSLLFDYVALSVSLNPIAP